MTRVQGSGLYRDYRGYIRIMEKKMETMILGYIGFRDLGLWGLGVKT